MNGFYVVAISGGVDSAVLLDMLVRWKPAVRQTGMVPPEKIIVAHFDHGIRPDSAADGRFVEGLANKHNLPFVSQRQELGAAASEGLARARRYEFLRRVASRYQARIITAHHADDVIETIAINLVRGTGWRGLAALSAPDVERPLLDMPKSQIYDYALGHRLEWVEDDSNSQPLYLRNRLRRKIAKKLNPPRADQLLDLFSQQRALRQTIHSELDNFARLQAEYERYFLIQLDQLTGLEILSRILQNNCGFTPTRPQLNRALIAIKAAQSGTQHQISTGLKLSFTRRKFIVQTD